MPNFRRSTLLACSLYASVTAAQAQSSVTIYGAVDIYAGYQSASGTSSRTVLNSGFNPNSLGFRGTEDLGNGLKAGFVLEGQPLLDTGAYGQGGKFFGRQSLLFLQNDWGRLELGRIHTAGRTFGIKYSASGWLTTDPSGVLEIAMGSSISPVMNGDTTGSRISNAVKYTSPVIAGFQGSLMQSASEGGTFATGQVKITIAGLTYTAGRFTTDLVYNHVPSIAGSQLPQKDFAVGAQYDFGIVRVMAAYQTKQSDAVAAPGSLAAIAGSKATDRLYLLGATVPLAASTLGVAIGQVDVAEAHRGRRGPNVTAPFSTVMDDMTAWSVGYTYNLSKRTQLFAAYGRITNDALGNGSLTFDLRPVAGGNSALLASGLRHSF